LFFSFFHYDIYQVPWEKYENNNNNAGAFWRVVVPEEWGVPKISLGWALTLGMATSRPLPYT
jgi:hypothetical protein